MADQPVPIAIVGMSCRFPGGATNLDTFWKILSEGKNTWSDVPSERFNWKSYYHDDPEMPGTTNHRGGHFLEKDVAAFDAGFFGISAADATSIDPQQRIQLETAYEALESAGIPLETIRGSRTAVCIATFNQDYEKIIYRDLTELPKYAMTGTGQALAANRISYFFDLHGPSFALDTGCSGSLVALHQACKSLTTKECDLALVGGTNLILSPEILSPMSNIHVLNKDGKCYSFDSRGQGYGRGEGGGSVVLKRLDDALAAGDPIRSILRNTACNQDGKTNGITLPSSKAQEDLIRFAYESVGLHPNETSYVEAHGTGTIAGDKAEMNAIGTVFGNRSPENTLFVGSVKGNIGHLENASGIAGVIKTVLALEKGFLPPNANLEVIKPDLDLKNGRIKILRRLERWSCPGVRRASINSFGYGGTNAHAIMESFPRSSKLSSNGIPYDAKNLSKVAARKEQEESAIQVHGHGELAEQVSHEGGQGPDVRSTNGTHDLPQWQMSARLFILTAKSEKSLKKVVGGLKNWLSNRRLSDESLASLAYTLSIRRSIMPWRFTYVASIAKNLEDALSSRNPLLIRARSAPPVAFLFTGMGAQWSGMARELCLTKSEFSESLRKSECILTQLGASWSLVDELLAEGSNSRLHESEIGQPASTAVQIALVDLLGSFGIKPNMVLGHSSGEVASAYAAGILSQAMALRVSYHRSFLANLSKGVLRSKGAMLAVALGEQEVHNQYPLFFRKRTIVVACVNSPSSTTISGDEAEVLQLKEALDGNNVFNRLLNVDTAYHSNHMQVVSEAYLRSMDGLETKSMDPDVEFFSSVTSEQNLTDFGPSYWVANLVSQVNFAGGLARLCRRQQSAFDKGGTTASPVFIEIGPHRTLAGPFRQTVADLGLAKFAPQYFPSLVRNEDSLHRVLSLIGNVFEQGCSVNFKAVAALSQPSKCEVITDLPSYPWDHSTTYWSESRLSKELRFRKSPYHNLLGLRVAGSTAPEPIWRHNLDVERHAWLGEHVIDDFAIFPASSYICMAVQAIQQLYVEQLEQDHILNYLLKDVSFSQALLLPDAPGKIEIQLTFAAPKTGSKSSWREFVISSILPSGTCTENCRGFIEVELETLATDVETSQEKEYTVKAQRKRLSEARKCVSKLFDSKSLYQELRSLGNSYGKSFATIKNYNFGDGFDTAHGVVIVPEIASSASSNIPDEPHVIHPTTLDAFLHSTIPMYSRCGGQGSVVIMSIKELSISSRIVHKSGHQLAWVTNLVPKGANSAISQVIVFQNNSESQEEPVISIKNLKIRGLSRAASSGSTQQSERDMSYRFKWEVDVDTITSLPSIPVVSAKNALSPDDKMRLLDTATAILVDLCLKEITDDDLSHSLPELLSFHKWMMRFLESSYCRSLVSGMNQAEMERTLAEAELAGVDGKAVVLVGKNFRSLLSGWMNPLSLLLHHDLLYRIYADESSTRCYQHIINYMKSHALKNPRMKVLELGGGTGGMTLPLLQALDDRGVLPLESYTFTDVSSGFFENARESFQKWGSYMKFKTLDIEKDFVGQGFSRGTYDVILASNVLHIPRSIEDTLKSVRTLLKPGGRLLMIETIRVVPYYNALFGAIPGWWIGINDGRPDSPLVPVERWNNLLLKSSFTGVDVVAFDYDGPARAKAMMVSRAREVTSSPTGLDVELVSTESSRSKYSALLQTLLTDLEGRGCRAWSGSWPLEKINMEKIYVVLDDGDKPILDGISEFDFESLKILMIEGRKIAWITIQDSASKPNPKKDLVRGFARTIRIENKNLNLVTLDAQLNNEESGVLARNIADILTKSFSVESGKLAKEREYVFQHGQLLIPRLLPDEAINAWLQSSGTSPPKISLELFRQAERPLKLDVGTSVAPDSFHFVDDSTLQNPLAADEVEIEIWKCGISYYDLGSPGQAIPAHKMAGEYVGHVTKIGFENRGSYRVGDTVCGFAENPYASSVRVKAHHAHHLPDSIPLIFGAVIPLAFSTAYYALVEIGHLEEGQTVLIHAAAGDVGRATLQIAQHVGARIFATVDCPRQRQVLMEKYGIPEDHIFSSRGTMFKQGVLRLTTGAGVDFILNTLSDDSLHDTWSCIAKSGTFVDVSHNDSLFDSQLALKSSGRNVTFAAFDILELANNRPILIRKVMKQVISMFEKGILKLNHQFTVVSVTDIEDAFKLIQARENSGKIVLEATKSSVVKVVQPQDTFRLRPDATYVIAGGLGGLGLEIARFMAERGARYLMILSRRTVSSSESATLKEEFASLGTEIRLISCDISSQTKVEELARSILSTLPLVQGIVQSAMVLQDRPLERMTAEEFTTPLQTKVNGTQYLIEAFQSPHLDFFLMLSSLVSVLGNSAQANYAAGNAYLDAVATTPNPSSNTHFMSLNLGAMADVGVVAANPKLGDYLVRQGYNLVRLTELLRILEYAMSPQAKIDNCHQIILGFNRTSMSESENHFMLENPMLSHIPHPKTKESSSSSNGNHQLEGTTKRQPSLEERIANAKDEDELKGIVAQAIAAKIAALLCLEPDALDSDAPVRELGLDSLVLIEVRHWIANKFKRVLQIIQISEAESLGALAAVVVGK